MSEDNAVAGFALTICFLALPTSRLLLIALELPATAGHAEEDCQSIL